MGSMVIIFSDGGIISIIRLLLFINMRLVPGDVDQLDAQKKDHIGHIFTVIFWRPVTPTIYVTVLALST